MNRARLKVIIISLASAISLSSNALLPQERTIIDVIAVEYPPFTSAHMATNGLSFEVLNLAAKHLSYTWKPTFYPPKRALRMIEDGNWCASFYPATQSKDHHIVDLHDEKFSISLVRKKQNTDFQWKQLSEFQGQSVALLRTSMDSLFAKQFIAAGIEMIFVETVDASLKMLQHGRVDFAMYDSFSFAMLDSDRSSELQFASTALIEMPVRMFINKKCLNVERLNLQPVKGRLNKKGSIKID